MKLSTNKFLTSLVNSNTIDNYLPRILILGKSNVGKSTLINALANNKIAYIAKTPGKTRMINVYELNYYYLLDAPGYGYAKLSKEQSASIALLIRDFLKYPYILVLVVIEPTRLLSDLDLDLIKKLQENKQKFLILINKMDKLNQKERFQVTDNELVKHYKDQILFISAKDNKLSGLKDIIKSINPTN